MRISTDFYVHLQHLSSFLAPPMYIRTRGRVEKFNIHLVPWITIGK